jgi:murein DD-endopeptidase MepM/ murein hydrolase activator NlpD
VQSAPSDPVVSAPVGGIICPVQGPVAFTDTWGASRSGGRVHKGVDMLAPMGTPTVAPVSGTVSHSGNSLGGLSWHLNGDNGHYYYGTHLSSYANVGAGHVEAGTVIGYVGDTGNARGTPHLHFEIHPNGGAAVNPYPAVRAAC